MTKLEWIGKHLIILVLTIGLIVFPVAPSFAAVTDLTGGPGGQPFSDEGLLAPDRSISEIAIQYDRYLTAIGAVATDASGTRVELPTYGKGGGSVEQIVLNPGEKVVGITGRSGELVDSITLKTNLQTYGPFGGFGGNDFTIDLPAGTEFVGFTGRSGNVVDALGLVYRDLPQLSLCSEGKTATNPANSHQYCLSAASTWTEAQQYGQSLGGYLVTVNDSAEQDWLLSTFGSQYLYWIGYSDACSGGNRNPACRDSEGNFVWASGQTPGYTNWLAGEPNNGKCFADEHYAAMNWFNARGQWNDLNNWGYYEDCGNVSQFCGEEGQIKLGSDVNCTVGFKPLMGIIEIEAQPKAVLKGMKWNDANGNGIQDSELIQGDNPDAIFVVDISRSSLDRFKGSPVGDVNGNGNPDEILDAELAGFSALDQQLIDLGFGDTAKVGIVVFGSGGSQVDVDLATPGQQLITKAGADNNGNGIPDVKEVLASIQSYKDPYNVGPGTNYEAALQNAEATLNAINSAPDQGNIIFLSDGEPSPQIQQNYSDEIQRIKASGVNLVAFGVGEAATLNVLRELDEDAQIFTTTDELLQVFGGVQPAAGSSSGAKAGLEPVLSGTTIYLDLNENGVLDPGEPSQVSDDRGMYEFDGLPSGTYVVREQIPEGYQQTFPVDGVHRVTVGDSEVLEGLNFGNTKS